MKCKILEEDIYTRMSWFGVMLLSIVHYVTLGLSLVSEALGTSKDNDKRSFLLITN